jgi:hypothetical protein
MAENVPFQPKELSPPGVIYLVHYIITALAKVTMYFHPGEQKKETKTEEKKFCVYVQKNKSQPYKQQVCNGTRQDCRV